MVDANDQSAGRNLFTSTPRFGLLAPQSAGHQWGSRKSFHRGSDLPDLIHWAVDLVHVGDLSGDTKPASPNLRQPPSFLRVLRHNNRVPPALTPFAPGNTARDASPPSVAWNVIRHMPYRWVEQQG